MANKKPMAKKKPKMKNFKEMLEQRKRDIDNASGFGPKKPSAPSQKKKADGTSAYMNRRKQENLV